MRPIPRDSITRGFKGEEAHEPPHHMLGVLTRGWLPVMLEEVSCIVPEAKLTVPFWQEGR